MNFNDISEGVAAGQLPGALSLPDLLCWQGLTNLKRDYEAGRFPPEVARVLKQKLKKAYQQEKQAYMRYLAGEKLCQDNIKKAEDLRNQIMKTDRLGEKLSLALECIGRMTGEAGFERLAMKGVSEDVGDHR